MGVVVDPDGVMSKIKGIEPSLVFSEKNTRKPEMPIKCLQKKSEETVKGLRCLHLHSIFFVTLISVFK